MLGKCAFLAVKCKGSFLLLAAPPTFDYFGKGNRRQQRPSGLRSHTVEPDCLESQPRHVLASTLGKLP